MSDQVKQMNDSQFMNFIADLGRKKGAQAPSDSDE